MVWVWWSSGSSGGGVSCSQTSCAVTTTQRWTVSELPRGSDSPRSSTSLVKQQLEPGRGAGPRGGPAVALPFQPKGKTKQIHTTTTHQSSTVQLQGFSLAAQRSVPASQPGFKSLPGAKKTALNQEGCISVTDYITWIAEMNFNVSWRKVTSTEQKSILDTWVPRIPRKLTAARRQEAQVFRPPLISSLCVCVWRGSGGCQAVRGLGQGTGQGVIASTNSWGCRQLAGNMSTSEGELTLCGPAGGGRRPRVKMDAIRLSSQGRDKNVPRCFISGHCDKYERKKGWVTANTRLVSVQGSFFFVFVKPR